MLLEYVGISRLASLFVADKDGNFKTSAEIRAIKYATRKAISVLNFSGGGYSYS